MDMLDTVPRRKLVLGAVLVAMQVCVGIVFRVNAGLWYIACGVYTAAVAYFIMHENITKDIRDRLDEKGIPKDDKVVQSAVLISYVVLAFIWPLTPYTWFKRGAFQKPSAK
jgi:hypothetical protein